MPRKPRTSSKRTDLVIMTVATLDIARNSSGTVFFALMHESIYGQESGTYALHVFAEGLTQRFEADSFAEVDGGYDVSFTPNLVVKSYAVRGDTSILTYPDVSVSNGGQAVLVRLDVGDYYTRHDKGQLRLIPKKVIVDYRVLYQLSTTASEFNHMAKQRADSDKLASLMQVASDRAAKLVLPSYTVGFKRVVQLRHVNSVRKALAAYQEASQQPGFGPSEAWQLATQADEAITALLAEIGIG